ncbi:MAG: hypothetical protein WCP95_04595 [Actinomycetes bacterium]
MQRRARAGVSLATAVLAGAPLAVAVAPVGLAAPAANSTTVTVIELASGDAVLRVSRPYAITSCSATSVPLALFVQSSTGRWLKVAASATPTHSSTCPFVGSPWLQTYNWTVNQVGTPAESGGPNRLNLAVGPDSPRSKFTADVWPTAPSFSD